MIGSLCAANQAVGTYLDDILPEYASKRDPFVRSFDPFCALQYSLAVYATSLNLRLSTITKHSLQRQTGHQHLAL